MEKKLNVNLGDRTYPIYVGENILDTIGKKLEENYLIKRATIISNPEIMQLYGENIKRSLSKSHIDFNEIIVNAGEEAKSLKQAEEIYDKLIESNNDRFMPIIALGGGVIGDLGGFIASTYMRGVPYLQVPTTLLAQVDSSVGGKVAVNHPQAKNIIGSFYQPRFVLADMNTLKSLPQREFLCGMAEVVKYALISADDFLRFLKENKNEIMQRDTQVLMELVIRCCRIKLKIVEQDELDFGIRAVLNFGHTIGHSIEAISGYNNVKHGEAVAIGMVGAAIISNLTGIGEKSLIEEVRLLLNDFKLPFSLGDLKVDDVFSHLKHDKKVLDGEIRFVLLKKPGEVVIENVDEKIIKEALNVMVSEGINV